MTKKFLIILATSLILLSSIQSGLAQQTAPLFIIHGTPDTTTNPPEVRTHASVINKSTAQSITDLTAVNFQMQEAEEEVATSNVSYEPVGLAVVVVVDRGGISAPGDPRIKEATDLVRGLMDRLSVTGAAEDDIIAIVGVGEEGALQPEENFSYNPVDTNLVSNALVTMEGETVRGGTPLYEGLDEAILLLTKNPDATIRDVLTHRRKVVVVFSDGVDPNFSDEARESDIIRKANESDVSLYTIGMARRNGQLGAERNLKRLASQTYGVYQLHNNDETHQQVLDLFDRLSTQRNQYVLTYETHLAKGDYTLNVEVTTDIGSAEDSATLSSILETPEIALTSPAEGTKVTVPYSRTLKGFVPTGIEFKVEITSMDEAERYPAEVQYVANGKIIGKSTAAPDFPFTWQVSDILTATKEAQTEQYTLIANADDAYLGTGMTSKPVDISVTWEKKDISPGEAVVEEGRENWWILLLVGALGLGLIVLLVLLLRTRGRLGDMAQQAVSSTTQALKGVTKRLGAAPQRAPGKLVILQGANVGKEFRLATQMVKVGRDPQFCDFALYDEYASNPHFSIQMEQNNFFITDEGSTNGTRLNGRPLQPQQRVPLQPDAIIEVGQTRLQFKRLGGTTRQIGQRQPSAGAGGQAGAPQQQRGGPTKKVP
jgi:pSer/pThr/pTyr-binding forkhead associated (FHA) protein